MANNKRSRRRDPAVEVASGVEELIARLRDEGVASGRTQGEQIVKNAHARADSIIKEAQTEAEEIISQAQKEADNLKRAGQEALEIAFRDTTLALRTQLLQQFTGEVQRLVGEEVQKQELLEKMILEVAGQGKEEVVQAQEVEIILPAKVSTLEELSRNPEEIQQSILTHFNSLISRKLLRQGIRFGFAKENKGGLQIRLVDQQVVLDLSDRAIADAILEHLQPRIRAYLEGIT